MKHLEKPVGLFGGTFDPVHKGHIDIATHVLQHFNLDAIEWIPSKAPPHRTPPIASPKQRVAMIERAIDGIPNFYLNDIEMKREGLSYTTKTLAALRKERPQTPFLLIMGEDAFGHLNKWYQWERLLDFAHLIVVNRPDAKTPDTDWMRKLREKHETHDKRDLVLNLHGKIYIESIVPTTASATEIRKKISSNEQVQPLLPDAVWMYILENNLYL